MAPHLDGGRQLRKDLPQLVRLDRVSVAARPNSKDWIVSEVRRVGAGWAQQLLKFLQRFGNGTGTLAGFELPLDFDDDLVGGIEAPGQDGGNIEQGRDVLA